MWIEPKETSGGQWTGWEEVKRKRYFVLQRHLSTDKPIEGLVFGLRSLLSRSPQMPYRIIISVRPFYAIALGGTLPEVMTAIPKHSPISVDLFTTIPAQILEHWKWINKNLVRTGRLESMEEKEVLAFANYIFSLLASGKQEKVKQILLTPPPVEADIQPTAQDTTDTTTPTPAPPHHQDDSSVLCYAVLPTSSSLSESHSSTASTDDDDRDLCKLCFEAPIDTVILDCGHTLLCSRCAESLKANICPICRSPIRALQKLYKC